MLAGLTPLTMYAVAPASRAAEVMYGKGWAEGAHKSKVEWNRLNFWRVERVTDTLGAVASPR